jgi:hypothetical protein
MAEVVLMEGGSAGSFLKTQGEGRGPKEICAALDVPYKAGLVFYALGAKSEKISAQKLVLLVGASGSVEDARTKVAIPENGVTARDFRQIRNATLFVQSTSAARKLTGPVLVRVEGGVAQSKKPRVEEASEPPDFFPAQRIAQVAAPGAPFPRDIWRMIVARVTGTTEGAEGSEEDMVRWACRAARQLVVLGAACRLLYHVVAEQDDAWRLIVCAMHSEPDAPVALTPQNPFFDPRAGMWKQQALMRLQPQRVEEDVGWTAGPAPCRAVTLVKSPYRSHRELGATIDSRQLSEAGSPLWACGVAGAGAAVVAMFELDGVTFAELLDTEGAAWEWARPYWSPYSAANRRKLFPVCAWYVFDFSAKKWEILGAHSMNFCCDETQHLCRDDLRCALASFLVGVSETECKTLCLPELEHCMPSEHVYSNTSFNVSSIRCPHY